jgi:hypothetical protein
MIRGFVDNLRAWGDSHRFEVSSEREEEEALCFEYTVWVLRMTNSTTSRYRNRTKTAGGTDE